MNKIPLTLGISRPKPTGKSKKTGEAALPQKIDAELKQKIFERDGHTCQGCGFKSDKYQEIHHIDNNPYNIKDSNLTTLCIFCHQCFNLEKVSDMNSGALIWLPEIEQSELHHIARAIYVARISQGPVAEAARKSLDVLMFRKEEARNRISTDDPYILSTVLRDYLGAKHYNGRSEKLDGIRLFPLDRRLIKEADLEFNQFPQILAYWRSKNGPFGGTPPQQWISVYQRLLTKTG